MPHLTARPFLAARRRRGGGRHARAGFACGLALVAAIDGTPLAAPATLTEHMQIGCSQQPTDTLECRYRMLDDGELVSATAEYDGVVVDGAIGEPYPQDGDITAIMILVDTSDPARQPVIDRIAIQVAQLLDAAAPHHRFALASFDTDLYLLAGMGTPRSDIARALTGLRATGKTTELYRNVREAVRLLGRGPGSRRVLLILSDGLAEDYAYHHDDVVALAGDENVLIHSIGYPRSVARSVALQTLRRLSDETGGIYVQADHLDFSIPDGVFRRMLRASDSGGMLRFDLAPLVEAGAVGTVDVPLALQTETQSFIVLAPVHLGSATTPTDIPATAAPPAVAPMRAPPPRPTPPAEVPRGLGWPWLAALYALLLLILAAVILVGLRVRRAARLQAPAGAQARKPLAYVIMDDGTDTRHVIDKTPWRIGRGRNNDLVIADHSVSRLHAEIRSNDEGQLLLKDLESLNGVFVNDNRVDTIQLREGDDVDIGDIRMRFTLHDESYASEEPTVLVRTRAPD